MGDSLKNGWPFRVLNIIDDFNREALHTEVDFSLPAERVMRLLDSRSEYRGYPERLRSDNGSEFIAQVLELRADEHNVTIFIPPGKPVQNSYGERFAPIEKMSWTLPLLRS